MNKFSIKFEKVNDTIQRKHRDRRKDRQTFQLSLEVQKTNTN